MHAHPVHSDFRLFEPVDCYVNNLKNGVILSYIDDEIKIVAIQKSVLYNDGNLVIILSTFLSPENDRRKILRRFCKRYLQYYEVRDLFPWEMPTKMMISCLLNVNFYRKYFFEYPPRNRPVKSTPIWRKWNVTVPNSVVPVKPLVCKWIYTCHRVMLSNDTQTTRILNFHPHFRETVILSNFYKFMTKNAGFFYRLAQQELKVSHEICIFRSMFISHKYW